jgi:hypothetical protein
MLNDIRAILLRDLATLRKELEAYPDEAGLWRTWPGVSNPAGSIALHLTGNLQHFIGAVLGGTGYVRDRDAEFTRRGVSREELLRQCEEASRVVSEVLEALPPTKLDEDYPLAIEGTQITTGVMLVRVSRHLAYHLGQINYHRRIIAA